MNGHYQAGDLVLGSWRLVRLLGQGSYGSVYEAQREDFGITYRSAIKIITIPSSKSEIQSARSEGMDNAEVTAYFRGFVEELTREFALMARLKGTANIVSYEDHVVLPHEGEIGWDIIIRMELLTPLTEAMEARQMTTADVVKLGVDICHALELCQKMNIVHRDIKPENIFLSPMGDYKLGDFGIARTVEKTTGGLSKKGTYSYMAPEVYKEEPYGPNVDIYSLGIVLYRLLNDNRMPFLPAYPARITHSDRETALARRIGGEALPDPAHASGKLADIIRKACAYDPKDRYATPAALRADLETVVSAEELEARSLASRVLPAEPTERTGGASQPVQDQTQGAFYGVPASGTTGGPVSAPASLDSTQGAFRAIPPEPVRQTPETPPVDQTQGVFSRASIPPEPPKPQPAPAPQPAPQPTPAPAPAPKAEGKKKTGLIIGIAAAAVALIVLLVVLLGGKSKPAAGPSAEGETPAISESGDAAPAESMESGESGGTVRLNASEWSTNPEEAVLWGEYMVDGLYYLEEGDCQTFADGIEMFTIPYDGVEYEFSVLPIQVDFCRLGTEIAGGFSKYYLEDVREQLIATYGEDGIARYEQFLSACSANFARMILVDRFGKDYTINALYSVDGSTISFYLFDLDNETFEFTIGAKIAEAQFTFEGRNLVLASGGSTQTYVPQDFSEYWTERGYSVFVGGCVADDASAYEDIVEISYSYYTDETNGVKENFYVYFSDGNNAIDPVGVFNEDGTFTISWQERYIAYNGRNERVTEPKEISGRYLWGGGSGLLLMIDGQIYRYQYSEAEYLSSKLSDVAPDLDVENIDEETRSKLLGTQYQILTDLNEAFENAGINAVVDTNTGKVTMDTSFLFDTNSDVLSDSGKAYLDGFLDVYAAVILPYMGDGSVSRIVVEGHTDTAGSYEYNLDLSERRAQSVADYCLERQPGLAGSIETEGLSFSDPVYAADGTVDMDASRRVVFRFTLSIG